MATNSTPINILWGQTNEQIRQQWNELFQSRIAEFNDRWIVHYQEQLPEPENWEEPLVEFLKITFKCRECANVWMNTRGLVHFFFRRRNQPEVPNETRGEILIWLQDQHCPRCSSPAIPEIDVARPEMNAVLSYLKMEIGWYYYNMQYTTEDENRIREIRTIERRETSNRMRTRWDRTLEQIRFQWGLIFDDKFQQFISGRQPEDRWTFQLDKVTKRHPLRAQQLWHWFLIERVEAGFKCSECDYVWESRKGSVSFWIWQNERLPGGRRQGGNVTIHVLGQKCDRCPGRVEIYETGDLQGDEIERVLSLLFMEIDYSLYGNNTYTYENEQVHEFKPKPWHRNLRQGHKKTFCQACSNKVCNKFYRTRCTEPANITDPVLNESDKRLRNPSVRD